MGILPKISINTDLSQFIYAIFVIAIVPTLLSFNTIYILKSFQRDMDFELNNKALLVESAIAIGMRDKINNTGRLKAELGEITQNLPEIRAIEIFTAQSEDLIPLVTTSESTRQVSDLVLNQLAWSTNKPYSKKIIAKLSTGNPERVFLVISPIQDRDGKKIGLLNIYLSAAQIDAISERTTRDSLFILIITTVAILLLLLNHFRFFEISILFKKLSEVDKLKDDFISVASHELQTPLTVIFNYAYMLVGSPVIKSNAQLKKYSQIIMDSSSRLKLLVSEVLDVSKIEQKRVKLNLEYQDLRAIIEKLVNEYSIKAVQKKIKITYQKPKDPLIVQVDPTKIQQIFYNLIDNAVKYTPAGEVTISHEVLNGKVKTYIKDTGIGISAEDRERLFSKFGRIYNKKTENIHGTGLGLWITKQLVEMMDGKIVVDSIENYGTQFAITFPLKSKLPPLPPVSLGTA